MRPTGRALSIWVIGIIGIGAILTGVALGSRLSDAERGEMQALIAIIAPAVEGWPEGNGLRIVGPGAEDVFDVGKDLRFGEPMWSPDGTRLIVRVVGNLESENLSFEFRMYDTKARLLAVWEQPSDEPMRAGWSPDSATVAVAGSRVYFFSNVLKLQRESEALGLPASLTPRPAWDPQSRVVVVQGGGQAVAVDRQGVATRFALEEGDLAAWLTSGELAIGSRSGVAQAKIWDPATKAMSERALAIIDGTPFAQEAKRLAATTAIRGVNVLATADGDHAWSSSEPEGPTGPWTASVSAGPMEAAAVVTRKLGLTYGLPRGQWVDVVVR
ncbi:MAG: hypothetical protein ACKVVT_16915 [Dehalococcoidia bacterium]